MKTEFHEDFQSEHADPLDSRSQDFDWQGLYRSLGEETVEASDLDYKALGTALVALFSWILRLDNEEIPPARELSRRMLTLAILICPQLIESNREVSSIARKLKCHRSASAIKAKEMQQKLGLATPKQKAAERIMAQRFIALAWTLDPSLIEGSPSLSGIARKLGCNKVTLSVHSAQATRDFGIHNRAQSHGWNFKPAKRSTMPQDDSATEKTHDIEQDAPHTAQRANGEANQP